MDASKQFADAFAACCITYDHQFSVEKARVYMELLGGYSGNEISQAFRQHMQDPDRGRFFPKPADIIHQINLQRTQALSAEKMALLWSTVVKAASNGRSPATGDQYLLAALQMIGGHKAVGYADPVELNRLQKEFAANYAAIAKAKAHELPSHLHNVQALTAMKTGLIKS